MVNLKNIATEQRNPATMHIDELSTLDMIRLINQEDYRVAESITPVCPQIAAAVDVIAEHLKNGGRLIYTGCGTSGRLGILDASECPPTFSVSHEMVQGVIAGGTTAIFKALEGAEDSRDMGREDLIKINFSSKDVLCGLAASGRTPYVLGAMEYAKSIGAPVLAVTCCAGSAIDQLADIGIAPMPGPEVLTGSTRLKSGTAQKMVLNMLSTGAMIKLGKVYGNLMVDMKASNEKLVRRCITIVCEATGDTEENAVHALDACDYHCKTAIVMLLRDVDADKAKELLAAVDGRVALAIKQA